MQKTFSFVVIKLLTTLIKLLAVTFCTKYLFPNTVRSVLSVTYTFKKTLPYSSFANKSKGLFFVNQDIRKIFT